MQAAKAISRTAFRNSATARSRWDLVDWEAGVVRGGGFGGGPGGGGPIAFGRLGRGFNVNQPHGNLYFYDDTSALDARPYSLERRAAAEGGLQPTALWSLRWRPAEYSQDFQWRQQDIFFRRLERNSREFAVRCVCPLCPQRPERSGDFSALATPIYNPANGSAIPVQRTARM